MALRQDRFTGNKWEWQGSGNVLGSDSNPGPSGLWYGHLRRLCRCASQWFQEFEFWWENYYMYTYNKQWNMIWCKWKLNWKCFRSTLKSKYSILSVSYLVYVVYDFFSFLEQYCFYLNIPFINILSDGHLMDVWKIILYGSGTGRSRLSIIGLLRQSVLLRTVRVAIAADCHRKAWDHNKMSCRCPLGVSVS